MFDFHLGAILRLLVRTTPFLVFRFLIYFGITLAYVLGTGAGAGLGYLVGHIGDNPGAFGVWGGVIGFGAVGIAAYLLREYLLYLVKAGHIAVLVELMEGRTLPEGRGQIPYAQAIVRERFAESSILFGVDQLVKGVLKVFNRAFLSITTLLPIPGIQGVARFVNTVINLSLTYLDEVILAYNMRTRSDNPWASSRTALILYAQNYKTFLKNAFFLAFVIWGLTLLVFLIILAPVAGLVALFPGNAGALTLIVALVFAWGIKQAVIEPIAMTALMQVFFQTTEGQHPDPASEQRLEDLTERFRQLGEKARGYAPAREPTPDTGAGSSTTAQGEDPGPDHR